MTRESTEYEFAIYIGDTSLVERGLGMILEKVMSVTQVWQSNGNIN